MPPRRIKDRNIDSRSTNRKIQSARRLPQRQLLQEDRRRHCRGADQQTGVSVDSLRRQTGFMQLLQRPHLPVANAVAPHRVPNTCGEEQRLRRRGVLQKSHGVVRVVETPAVLAATQEIVQHDDMAVRHCEGVRVMLAGSCGADGAAGGFEDLVDAGAVVGVDCAWCGDEEMMVFKDDRCTVWTLRWLACVSSCLSSGRRVLWEDIRARHARNGR